MMNKKDDKESQFPVEPLRLNTKVLFNTIHSTVLML